MIICNNCVQNNREGSIFCENCGVPLKQSIVQRTRTRQLEKSTNILSAKATWGTARLSQKSEVVLHIMDSKTPVRLEAEGQSIIGREDQSSNNHPDINLIPYGALEKGVSRIHAMIERSEDTLTITDMGSSNGTFLNGQRLVSNQPRVIRDGDEIRFGKLIARIYFK